MVTARPAELTALDERLGRLRARLRAGDPDMPTDELQLAIDRAEGKRQALLATQPAGGASAKMWAMLPKAADADRKQIRDGLTGQPREAAKARAALKQLVGGHIRFMPDRKAGHLNASFGLNRLPLFKAAGGVVGSSGSGGTFRHTPTFPSCLITRYFSRQGATSHHIKVPSLRLSANL